MRALLLFLGDDFQHEWRHHDGVGISCGFTKISL
jgi:hypothetical protein